MSNVTNMNKPTSLELLCLLKIVSTTLCSQTHYWKFMMLVLKQPYHK